MSDTLPDRIRAISPSAQAGCVLSLVAFAEQALEWPLEPKQRELLEGSLHRVILNCTRQWGKSSLAAVMVLHRLVTRPRAMVLLAGPGLRQSRELLEKVRALALRNGLVPPGPDAGGWVGVSKRGARGGVAGPGGAGAGIHRCQPDCD